MNHLRLLPIITLVLLVGCESQQSTGNQGKADTDVAIDSLRTQYVSTEVLEPTMAIPRLRKKLTPQDVIEGEPEPEPPPESLEVVLHGKVCEKKALADNPDFPWQPGKAAFMMIDPEFKPSAHAEEHADGEECPFCLKKEQDAQALVQVTDENGAVLSVDARELFQIAEGQEVIVSGTASILGGILMVDAVSVSPQDQPEAH